MRRKLLLWRCGEFSIFRRGAVPCSEPIAVRCEYEKESILPRRRVMQRPTQRAAARSIAEVQFLAIAGAASAGSTLGRRERQRQGRSIRCQDRKAIAAVTGAEIRNTTHHGAA